MIYGYLRVSSDKQDVNSQRQGVEKFAEEKGWQIEEYITDEGVSGGKDPDKRKLGSLLQKVKKDDVIISSEISRLGRDLYMVMDILHFCMERGCIIYTVKDHFVLGNEIQSKVLAFAFGLAAEIERQMIQQRTREGLRLRMLMGILLGRPPLAKATNGKIITLVDEHLEEIKKAIEWGASGRSIAKKLGIDRNTLARHLVRVGISTTEKWLEDDYKQYMVRKEKQLKETTYKEGQLCLVELPRERVRHLIEMDLTIPEISKEMPEYTYEQLYDSISNDLEFNILYRKHGQMKIPRKKS